MCTFGPCTTTEYPNAVRQYLQGDEFIVDSASNTILTFRVDFYEFSKNFNTVSDLPTRFSCLINDYNIYIFF